LTSDPTIRRLFGTARGFVTPYAASGIDEYMAECGRALHRLGNDPRSSCPRATPERFQDREPEMYAYLRALFAEYPPAPAHAPRRRRQPHAAGTPASRLVDALGAPPWARPMTPSACAHGPAEARRDPPQSTAAVHPQARPGA
jgi:hypothetical protein